MGSSVPIMWRIWYRQQSYPATGRTSAFAGLSVFLTSLSCGWSWSTLQEREDGNGTACAEADGQRREREAGAPPVDGAGAGGAAGERGRGLPARRDRPDQLLRLEAALPARGAGRSQGPASDRQEPPDDHAARGGGADRRAGAAPPGLWLQPARGAPRAGRPAPVGDHDPEDPQRQGPRHAAGALAGAGAQERRAGGRAQPRAGGGPLEAQPLVPGQPRTKGAVRSAANER